MKKILFIVFTIGLAFTACKSKKELAKSPYTTDPATQPKVFSVPTSDTQQEAVKEEPKAAKITDTQPVAIRKEQVSFTSQEDRAENEVNSYFVIIGSFSQLENAKNYRETLINQGFSPIILHSETGYYRVCVNSHKNEQEARNRVAQIRQSFPQYSDVWLLIKE